jgi:hypothetical protein
MREAGRKQLIIGLVIAGVGLVLSLGTYAAASSGGGGRYFIFWGAVVFGLIRAGRGFSMMSKAGSPASGQPAQPTHALQRIQVEHSSTSETPPPPPTPQPSPPASSMWD